MRMATARLQRVVDELLDVARLESGAVQPRREWCDVGELIHEARARAALAPEAIVLDCAELPPAHLDPALATQALAILLSNAATHGAAHDAPVVTARTDGAQLVITVADRGPGLPPGGEERIFARFARATDARPGGLGLGLSIARRLAEALSGTLTAENRPAGGARFTMRLPIGGDMKLPAAK
jgi:two-component system sensor histidine kinase KdpD